MNAAAPMIRSPERRAEHVKQLRIDLAWAAEEKARIEREILELGEDLHPLLVRDYRELLALQFPEERYLVDRLIPSGGFSVVSGKGGRWKTWLLGYMAICVATGKPFLHDFQTVGGRVLILALEGGPREHQRRIASLSRGDQFGTPSDLPLFTYEGPFQAESAGDRAALGRVLREIKPDLVAVDHVRALMPGDENDSSFGRDLQLFVQGMQAEQPATWVCLAHEGRGNAGTIRGTSAQEYALDAQLSVERTDHGTGRITHVKARTGIMVQPFEFRFVGPEEPGGAGFVHLGRAAANAQEAIEDVDAAVLAVLRTESCGALLRSSIIGQLPYSPDQIDRSIRRLKGTKIETERIGKQTAVRLLEACPLEGRHNG